MDVEICNSHDFDPSKHLNLEIRLQSSDIESVKEESVESNGSLSNGEIMQAFAEKPIQDQGVPASNEIARSDLKIKQEVVESSIMTSADETDPYISDETTSTESESAAIIETACSQNELEKENMSQASVQKLRLILSLLKFSDGTVLEFQEQLLKHPAIHHLQKAADNILLKVHTDTSLSKAITTENNMQDSIVAQKHQIQNLNESCKQLECKNSELTLIMKRLEEKLASHDMNAKRTIARLQKDFETKVNDLNKKCTIAENEKQASVMNFARREKELLDLRKQKEGAEQFARNAGKERDKAVSQFKALKTDLTKLKSSNEKKETETTAHSKEMEKLKEEINSQVIKVRWAQNKLKAEVESHKETKEKCEKMVLEIQHAKEETEQIRKNCQEMIKTYQESEEIKSNALDIELKEKNQLLTEKVAKVEQLQATLKKKQDDFNQLKIKHKDIQDEHKALLTNAASLDHDRLKNERIMREYEEVMNKQKATASEMNTKMQELFDLQSNVEDLNETVHNLNDALQEAVSRRDTALHDLACKERKEQELLMYTEKVSSKNTQLTVEIEEVNSKVELLNNELANSKATVKNLENEVSLLKSTSEQESTNNLKIQTSMNSRLEEKEHTICQLLLQLEELKDDMRTIKRKNAASVKDLTRQLNQVRKKTESNDTVSSSSITNSTNHSADGGSMGSRTSSITSLDRIPSYSGDKSSGSNYEHISVPETAITGPDSQDRQMLIERIVRLQQIHAKKNEKIDFLNEHVHQLVEALQKKQRLIQHYIMREESGALAPPRQGHDSHKRPGLTLDLSIEINQKMQSVLEDTLLKNITLKESLEMLGKEIERLSAQSSS